MAQVKVLFDREGNTLTVWFGDPSTEYVCEETGDEVVLMKDEAGKVIGFEKLNFSVANGPNRCKSDLKQRRFKNRVAIRTILKTVRQYSRFRQFIRGY